MNKIEEYYSKIAPSNMEHYFADVIIEANNNLILTI